MIFPKGINVVDCERFDFNTQRDFIVLKDFEDFIYFATDTVFRKGKEHYIIQSDIIYFYKDETKKANGIQTAREE